MKKPANIKLLFGAVLICIASIGAIKVIKHTHMELENLDKDIRLG